VRFTAKGLRSARKRLGLSAAEYAKLAGVSTATVYNFESGKTNPRQSLVVKLVAIRDMGKKEAQAKLGKLTTSE
jgi:predicted transcriptional regulator